MPGRDFLVQSGGFAVEAEACGRFGGGVRDDHLGPLAGSDLRVVEIVANIRLRRFGFERLLLPGFLVKGRMPGRDFLVQSGGFAVEAEACGRFGGGVRDDHLGPLAGSDLQVVEIVANIRLRRFGFERLLLPGFLVKGRMPGRDFLVQSGGFAVEAEACGRFGGGVRDDHLGPLAGSDLQVVEIVANIRLGRFGSEGMLSPGLLIEGRLLPAALFFGLCSSPHPVSLVLLGVQGFEFVRRARRQGAGPLLGVAVGLGGVRVLMLKVGDLAQEPVPFFGSAPLLLGVEGFNLDRWTRR